jgi:tetratricopeptide (TPR) repeat protein
MGTRLKVDLATGSIEVNGEADFVRLVYADFRERLLAHKKSSPDPHSEVYGLLAEAHISGTWNEYQRAYTLYERALERCPKGADNSLLADILEGMESMEKAIENTEQELPSLQRAVEAAPESAEKRFQVALALSRLGREKEALAEYEAALSDPTDLDDDCFRDLWNNIGWYYYRRGRYHEALKWFDQCCKVADVQEGLGKGSGRLGLENKILAYCALGMVPEAQSSAMEFVQRYGRFHWPERRALAKLGINADAIYIESRRKESHPVL